MRAVAAGLCLAGLCLAGLLGGCGFHPLYAPQGHVSAGLGQVFVDPIANRPGQLLREALQVRLEGSGGGAKRYELSVQYFFTGEGLGIQTDNSSNRNRYTGTAHWALHLPGPLGDKVVSGTARAVDGANVIDEQFFYSDLSAEAIQRRMGDALADQIVQALAVYFHSHPEQA